jgi:hypothetical protein
MSYSTIDWVYNQNLPAQEKLILVYIAKCENPNEPCFASVKHLANKCGVSTRTIQRILKKLCSAGYVISTPRFRSDGSQTSNFYTVNVIENDTAVSPPHDINVAGGSGSIGSPPTVDKVTDQELPKKTKSKTPLREALGNVSQLAYPGGLSMHSKSSVDRILQGISLDDAQMLLDELAGAMANGLIRKAPEYWLSGVAMKYRAGQFRANLGLEIARERKRKSAMPAQERQNAQVLEINREIGNKVLAKLQRNRPNQ